MAKPLLIGNASAFWGDSPDAAARLVSGQPDLDYVTLDYLAEVSLSIMAIQRERDPAAGYAKDFVDVIKSLVPLWKQGSHVKVITNAGGLNPHACASACLQALKEAGCVKSVSIVSGDDVLANVKDDPLNPLFHNSETHKPVSTVVPKLVTANAYLGAAGIAHALRQGADIVITGRVADPSLTVAPCLVHFDWPSDAYDRLAGATVAGHLIECGTQVTGGISNLWMTLPDPSNIGFPYVIMEDDGSFVITKPQGTGGVVDEQTVKEQLLYEIGDPAHYLSPDVAVSLLSLTLQQEGEDRVRVSGAKGKEPPLTLKVSATYKDGYRADGMVTVVGADAEAKARRAGEMLLKKLERASAVPTQWLAECLGAGDTAPGVLARVPASALRECILRIAVHDQKKEVVERFSKELASLVTCGPPGTTGYTSGRPKVRPVFGYWPCLIRADVVKTTVSEATIL